MHRKPIFILLWLTTATVLLGQQSLSSQYVSDSQGISFEELSRLAFAQNKDLVAARESFHQAEGRLTQARLRPNPTVDISKTTDAVFAREGDTAFSITFSQQVELAGKRAKRVTVEEASIEIAKAEIADAERILAGRLRNLYMEAIGAASRLNLFERLDSLNQQMTNVMDVRLRAGDASRLDSRLLAAQANQVRAQRQVAQNQLAGLLLQVRALAGLSLYEPLILKRPAQTASLLEAEDAAVGRAFENRPDLKAAKLREAFAEAGIALAKSQVVPNLNAFVRYAKDSIPIVNSAGGARSFEKENVLEFGVSIPLPLFNHEQGNIAVAASDRLKARAGREALETSIRRDVVLAYRRYQTAQETLQILSTGVVQPNQESLQIVQLAYGLGELRLLDIVSQQRVVIEAETAYLDAQTELNSALADLEQALGDPIL